MARRSAVLHGAKAAADEFRRRLNIQPPPHIEALLGLHFSIGAVIEWAAAAHKTETKWPRYTVGELGLAQVMTTGKTLMADIEQFYAAHQLPPPSRKRRKP